MFIFLLNFFLQTAPVSLEDAYQRAKEHRTEVKIGRLDKEIAQQEKKIVVGTVLPRLSARAQAEWQEKPSSSSTRSIDEFQHSSQLSLQQKLFQGGSEFFTWKAGRAAEKRELYNIRSLELALYQEVAELYFRILYLQKQHANLSEKMKILEQQVSYYKERTSIGQAKTTDLASTQSQFAISSSERLSTEIELEKARRELQWMTGLASFPEALETVFEYDLGQMRSDLIFQDNPEYKALLADIEQIQNLKNSARGEFIPQIDAGADYFLHRSGTGSESDWQVSLSANWEFFSGFQTKNKVSVHELELQKLKLHLEEFKKRSLSLFESLKSSFLTQRENLQRLEEAVELSKKSYDLQRKDSGLNLVSQLEVLRSLESYIDAKTLLDQHKIDQQLEWIKLNLLIGRIP